MVSKSVGNGEPQQVPPTSQTYDEQILEAVGATKEMTREGEERGDGAGSGEVGTRMADKI